MTVPHEPDPCLNLDHLAYYGQRPWRELSQSLEPADAELERKGIQTLQHLESCVNHSVCVLYFVNHYLKYILSFIYIYISIYSFPIFFMSLIERLNGILINNIKFIFAINLFHIYILIYINHFIWCFFSVTGIDNSIVY